MENDEDVDSNSSASPSFRADNTPFSDLADSISDDNQRTGEPEKNSDRPLSRLRDLIEQRGGEDGTRFDVDNVDRSAEQPTEHDASDFKMGDVDEKSELIFELHQSDQNILLKGPADCGVDDVICSSHVSSSSDTKKNVLLISVGKSAQERVAMLQAYNREDINDVAVIKVKTHDYGKNEDKSGFPGTYKQISNPKDLRRIGITATKILSKWEKTNHRSVICFDSLSEHIGLIDDNQFMFRFLHVLHSRVASGDAVAHYHFDPTNHSKQTVRTFAVLFDAAVQYDENGSIDYG